MKAGMALLAFVALLMGVAHGEQLQKSWTLPNADLIRVLVEIYGRQSLVMFLPDHSNDRLLLNYRKELK